MPYVPNERKRNSQVGWRRPSDQGMTAPPTPSTKSTVIYTNLLPKTCQLARQQIWKPLRGDSRWGLRSSPGDPTRGHFFKWGACRGGGWGQPPGREWGETGEKRPAVSDPCRGSDLGLTSHLSKQSNNQIYPGVVTARGQRHLREAYSRSVALPRRERNGHHKDRQV